MHLPSIQLQLHSPADLVFRLLFLGSEWYLNFFFFVCEMMELCGWLVMGSYRMYMWLYFLWAYRNRQTFCSFACEWQRHSDRIIFECGGGRNGIFCGSLVEMKESMVIFLYTVVHDMHDSWRRGIWRNYYWKATPREEL